MNFTEKILIFFVAFALITNLILFKLIDYQFDNISDLKTHIHEETYRLVLEQETLLHKIELLEHRENK